MILTGIIVLSILIIAAALFVVKTQNLLYAIIGSGVISLLASILYLILAAPDVAMTEASIGSGLTTIVFLYALNKVRKGAKDD